MCDGLAKYKLKVTRIISVLQYFHGCEINPVFEHHTPNALRFNVLVCVHIQHLSKVLCMSENMMICHDLVICTHIHVHSKKCL